MKKDLIVPNFKNNPKLFVLFASLTAFCTYSCMYAFRKPFTILLFEGETLFSIDLKILLIVAQLIGYTLSKFVGIKLISEMKNSNRAKYIILLVLISEIALLGFALSSNSLQLVFIFFNGLPLGMIWGLVVSYLEGRKYTEILGSVLTVTFIVSSGLVKTVGQYLINVGIEPLWMPFATGLVFFPLLILSVYLMEKIPAPNQEDIALRTKRNPMNKEDRKNFVHKFSYGLILFIVLYVLLTIFREFRDNFMPEIWKELGYEGNPAIFSLTEIPVSLFILFLLGILFKVKNNTKAFNIILLYILLGCVLTGVSSILYSLHYVGSVVWIMLIGAGVYLAYIPFNALLFERLISSFKISANVGFLIYLADSFGYLGSIFAFFSKDLLVKQINWTHTLIQASYIVAIIGFSIITFCLIYFHFKKTGSYFFRINIKNRNLIVKSIK